MNKVLTIFCILVTLVILYLEYYPNTDNTDLLIKEKQYNNKIDSLLTKISKNNEKIHYLDSVNNVLFVKVKEDNTKLQKISKQSKQYKDKYEKEHNILISMSRDSIISKFTSTFQ